MMALTAVCHRFMYKTWVFFATSPPIHSGLVALKLVLRLRWSRTARNILLSWVVRLLTRSPLVHVCIGSGDVVLDPSIDGNRFWATTVFAMKYSRLAWCYEFRTAKPISFNDYVSDRPKRVLPSVLRWFLRGHWPAEDCVTTTSNILRSVGEPVPANITSPQELFDWLRSRGHELIDMGKIMSNEEESKHPLDNLSDNQLTQFITAMTTMIGPAVVNDSHILSDHREIMNLQYKAGQYSVVQMLQDHLNYRHKRRSEATNER